MEELIAQFNSTLLDDPYTKLIYFKDIAEDALISTKTDQELFDIYKQVEYFNLYIKDRVSFDINTYSDNPCIQKIIVRCNEYYSLCFEDTIRHRLVQSLNLYNHILMCV